MCDSRRGIELDDLLRAIGPELRPDRLTIAMIVLRYLKGTTCLARAHMVGSALHFSECPPDANSTRLASTLTYVLPDLGDMCRRLSHNTLRKRYLGTFFYTFRLAMFAPMRLGA